MPSSQVIFVGAGIVGLASAYRFSERHPETKLLILEKEPEICLHQTGRNSGVIHSGIYYKPGSMKALTCRAGRAALIEFCSINNVQFELCGKVIVAVKDSETERLANLVERAGANGIECELIGKERLAELEPHVSAKSAIHIPETGIVDYVGMCKAMVSILEGRGNKIVFNAKVDRIKETATGVAVETNCGEFEGSLLVNCAGVYSDRVVRSSGQTPTAQIVPFRGEYFELKPDVVGLCKNLIYPVPDPAFPFLGVHFTRMILGGVECGPNAVLAFGREGYFKTNVNLRDLYETFCFSGFRRLAKKHFGMAAQEMMRSVSKSLFVKSLQQLIPAIQAKDIVAAPAGIRAQAIAPDGSLIDDFCFSESDRAVHVVNAPSPGATASLAIGDHIVDRLETHIQ